MIAANVAYWLQRADQEQVQTERAASPQTAIIHIELRDRYLDRAATQGAIRSIVRPS